MKVGFSPSWILNQCLFSSPRCLHTFPSSVKQPDRPKHPCLYKPVRVPGKLKPLTQPRQQETLCLSASLPEKLIIHGIQAVFQGQFHYKNNLPHKRQLGPQTSSTPADSFLPTNCLLLPRWWLWAKGNGPSWSRPAGWSSTHGGGKLCSSEVQRESIWTSWCRAMLTNQHFWHQRYICDFSFCCSVTSYLKWVWTGTISSDCYWNIKTCSAVKHHFNLVISL